MKFSNTVRDYVLLILIMHIYKVRYVLYSSEQSIQELDKKHMFSNSLNHQWKMISKQHWQKADIFTIHIFFWLADNSFNLSPLAPGRWVSEAGNMDKT